MIGASAVAPDSRREAPYRLRLTMTSTPPVLETERLILRAHQRDDLADLIAMWGDPQVVRFIGGRAFTPEECWWRLLRYVGHWDVLGFGYWAARERATGRFVGDVGLADLHRDIVPPLGEVPEAGWVLAPWAHGKGLATEAMQAVLAWGDRTLPADHSVCLIDVGHAASVRVAEKLGYRERLRTTYKGDAAIVLERARRG
jgi:RimJ/RimL family protein N-acetyltransferase